MDLDKRDAPLLYNPSVTIFLFFNHNPLLIVLAQVFLPLAILEYQN